MTAPADTGDLAFEGALDELEALVERLEAGDLALEQALATFERGVALSRRCAELLDRAEQRIDELVRAQGGAAVRPFSAENARERLSRVDAQDYLAACLPRVERALDEALPRADEPPARLHAAMRHLLFPGGKRLRPALALAAAEAVGGDADAALPAAVAVELVHVYSLVHDDLPCMDDDVERRGRPTVHVAFDEATAVLAGDALLTAAFAALVAGAGERDAAARVLAVRDLARAAGAAGLVGGQVDDLARTRSTSAAAVESVHARKSAALIAAVDHARARGSRGASEALLAKLSAAGVATGIAFQITDDLLDADDDEGCSLVRVIGEAAARERAQALLDQALAEIAELGARAEPLRALLRYAVQRKL